MKAVWRLSARTWLAALGLVALFAGGALASVHLDNNFHAIVTNEAYRSGQPSPDQIRAYREKYRIASIINLRGAQPGSDWYDAEVQTAKELGIRHFDFSMSPRQELTPEQSRALIAMMRSAPKPVLIHCRAGSDRTGLAAALYMAAVAGINEETSESQLSIRFGHFAVPIIGPYAMDQTFEAMEPSLGFFGS
ncbi:MAG: tyrosine-protein phosphatase [Mesorhizobium sp.]